MKRNALWGSLALVIATAAWGQAPTGLAIKTATNKRVDLTWSGTAASYTIQRRVLGGSFGNLQNVAVSSFSDTTIDAYTTYQYQVVVGTSAASNLVTAGPPPAGFSVTAPSPGPAGSDIANNYGYNLTMTLDANGDPAFAFIFADPNLDSHYADSRIEFRSWNRALYKWNDIVHVTTIGDVATTFHAAVSIACDTSTNTFGIASQTEAGPLKVFISADGVTWTAKASFETSQDEVSGPSLALANGNIHLAYSVSSIGLKYVTGKLSSDAATWATKIAPKVSGIDLPRQGITPSLALDSNGIPGIAAWADDLVNSYNEVLLYWAPASSGSPVKVMDSQNRQSDQLAVKLQFFRTNPRVLVYVQRNDGDFGVGLHVARSDNGGGAWATPVLIPPDGDSSTDYPFDLAVDSAGRGAVFFGQNGSSGDQKCGNPKISRSDDFSKWTTCAVAGLDATSQYYGYPAAMAAAFAGNDRIYWMWWDRAGIVMYREPPAGAITGPNISDIENGATYVSGGVVPGSWVQIMGANFSGVTRLWADSDFTNGDALPTALSGVSVKINGLTAPVYYISPTQINVQAPAGVSGNVSVQVTHNGVSSNAATTNAVGSRPACSAINWAAKHFPRRCIMARTPSSATPRSIRRPRRRRRAISSSSTPPASAVRPPGTSCATRSPSPARWW
jgi:hypothetical protein